MTRNKSLLAWKASQQGIEKVEETQYNGNLESISDDDAKQTVPISFSSTRDMAAAIRNVVQDDRTVYRNVSHLVRHAVELLLEEYAEALPDDEYVSTVVQEMQAIGWAVREAERDAQFQRLVTTSESVLNRGLRSGIEPLWGGLNILRTFLEAAASRQSPWALVWRSELARNETIGKAANVLEETEHPESKFHEMGEWWRIAVFEPYGPEMRFTPYLASADEPDEPESVTET